MLLIQEERKTHIKFHLFSISMQLKDWVLDLLTLRIMRNRLAKSAAETSEESAKEADDKKTELECSKASETVKNE